MNKLFKIMTAGLVTLTLGACAAQSASSTAASSNTGGSSAGTQTGSQEVFKIGAIPDLNAADLARGYDDLARHLTEKTGVKVEYVPSVDYAALVTAFDRGEIHMAWFGGLTGVQAQAVTPEAEAIAQRPQDAKFQSVFIKQKGLDIKDLAGLKGKSFTFGSESSTSGHLMPRHFMQEAGLDPEKDLNGSPNYSGSHDKTYLLVESGAFETGAVNIQYWEKAVSEKTVDTEKVEAFYTTPEYYDYNWTINDVDPVFGEGTKQKFKDALLAMDKDDSLVMDLLSTDKFIETSNANYDAIREVAKKLGIIK